MPYKHELANPLGYIDIANDDWIKERLKTYSFGSSSKEINDRLALLKVEVASKVSESIIELKSAFAIDGSVSTLETPNIAALKIGSVRKDLKDPIGEKRSGPLDPSLMRSPFKAHVSMGLLPGKGITSKEKWSGWDAKLREELFQTLKHMKVPETRENISLLRVMRRTLSPNTDNTPLECPNCSIGRIDFPENIYDWECDVCRKPVYYSDYMAKSFFKSTDKFTHSMLQMERLLLQGIITETSAKRAPAMDIASTIFIGDGALQFYTLPEVSELVLQELQSLPTLPIVVSFMKSGHVEKLFNMDGIEDVLKPGEVGMITDKLRMLIGGDPTASGVYGKSFAYRTLRGDKYFAFNSIPKTGPAHSSTDSEVTDSWNNYPHISTICKFIEDNATDENGFSTAALDIIAEANHVASLPFHLSKDSLAELISTEADLL